MPSNPLPTSGQPTISHVELLLECVGRRPQAGRPIFVGCFRGLLGAWLREVGIEEKPGVEWRLHGRLSPAFKEIAARFEGILGRRMHRYLSRSVDTCWRWMPGERSDWIPHFGIALIPVDRLWTRSGSRGATVMDPSNIKGQEKVDGHDLFPYFGTNGYVAIDLSEVTTVSERVDCAVYRSLVERVIRNADAWKVIRRSGLECNIRLVGLLDDLLNDRRPLEVSWCGVRKTRVWMDVALPDRGRSRKVPCTIEKLTPMIAEVRPSNGAS